MFKYVFLRFTGPIDDIFLNRASNVRVSDVYLPDMQRSSGLDSERYSTPSCKPVFVAFPFGV